MDCVVFFLTSSLTSLGLPSSSVTCIAEVAKGAYCFKWRRHKILKTHTFFLITTINQVVLCLIGIKLSF